MSHKNKVTQNEDELKSILFIQSCSVHNDVKVSEIAFSQSATSDKSFQRLH